MIPVAVRRHVMWLSSLALPLVIASSAFAQQRVARDASAESRGPRTAEQVFARTVSVRLTEVTLERAVQTLAASAKVRVYYRPVLLQAVQSPVSVVAENVPLGVALDRLLSGRHLQAIALGEDVITIKPIEDAQGQGVVTGVVRDAKTKQPVFGATVVLDGNSKGVRTDEQGAYRLSTPSGTHTVTIRAVGYVKQAKSVTVTEEGNTPLDVALDASTSVLDEVIVTGTVVATERKAIPNPITVITADEIEKRGITRIEQLFRGSVPGVVALDEGSMGYSSGQLGRMDMAHVYVRGSSTLKGSGDASNTPDGTPLKTYVDGVELLDSRYLGTLDPKSIERIEIIAGPQAATVYGSGAMGGVMQIFTKKGSGRTAPEVTLSAKYGILQNSMTSGLTPSHSDMLSVAGGSGPEFSYSGTLSYEYLGQWRPDQFARKAGASVGATHTRGAFTASGSVSATAGKNGTSERALSPYYADRQRSGEFTGYSSYVGRSQIQGSSFSQTTALNLDYRAADNWQHHATIGRSQTRFALDPLQPGLRSPSDSMYRVQSTSGERTTLGYNTTFAYPASGAVSSNLTAGFNGSMGDQTTIQGYQATKNQSNITGISSTSAPIVTKALDDESWGGFANWRVGFFDRLYLTLGVRAERNPAYGSDHRVDWTPTNGIAYTMEMGELTMKLLGSYGRATRAPTAGFTSEAFCINANLVADRYLCRRANPDLRPEYSRGPQGGIELYYGNVGSLTITHYQQRVTDLIQSVFVDTLLLPYKATADTLLTYVSQYLNTANIKQHGWEATSSVNFGSLSLRGTYSWNDSRIFQAFGCMNGATCYWSGMSFINVPTHSGSIIASYAHGPTSVTLTTNYIGQMPKYRTETKSGKIVYAEATSSRLSMYVSRLRNVQGEVTTPGYVKSDLAISHRLTSRATFTVNVTNLTNSYDSDAAFDYPGLGRQTLLGLSIRR